MPLSLKIFRKSHWARYSWAFASIAVIFVFHVFLLSTFHNYVPMTLFLGSIVVAAWLGGVGPGLLATVLGALAESYYFINPPLAFLSGDTVELTRVLIFLLEGVGISLLFGEFHKAENRILESEAKLQKALENEKQAHAKTEKALRELDHNQQQLMREREAAEKASHIKSLFLTNMSHEIRTPLVSILGYTELLKDPNLAQHERLEYLSVIERTGNNLAHIINDILDISKVESGRMELERSEFSMQKLLSEIYSILSMKASEKELSLEFIQIGNVPPMVKTDPIRLRQILMSVIGNAIKFSRKGTITLSYEAKDYELRFVIDDQGIGISEEQQQKLFEVFYQGDTSITRKFGGSGLGLALSHGLAKMLGGQLSLVQSVLEKGSTFSLGIPYEPALSPSLQSASSSQKAEESSAFANRSLLLVEDSIDNQMLYQRVLSKLGFQVEIANNGQEALDFVERKKFDLILMDMQMPIMDGHTATQTLRQKNFQIPIIALTAHAMKEDREKCLQSGCDDYLSKPASRAQLVEVLHKHLKLIPLNVDV